ncbi:DinB family protein [Undibacterium jejuense]|uniref:DinB family protein n=1 Tax=Undibacterium jejuense TaxID=1344949 RepID=A0A923HGZ3_9BURK|nr:DinB family protein [Undibacterium jejuense]MBC3862825.1 DinB family protein [Undibacterium jejuense]
MNHFSKNDAIKKWADEVFLRTVIALSERELTAPRSIIFGNLILTLHHSSLIDYVWQSHLLSKPHGLTTRNPETHPTMAELYNEQQHIDQLYVTYTDALTDKRLGEILEFEFIGGGKGAMARSDILLHVINHTTYHRCHAADILYNIKVFPPTTDYPVFLREMQKMT